MNYRTAQSLREIGYGVCGVVALGSASHLAEPDNFLRIRGFRETVVQFSNYLWRLRNELSMFKKKLGPRNPRARRRTKTKTRAAKKDPIFVDGERPRPMYVDYKDVELLKKLINRHGKIVSRRKTGCSAASQHAVTDAIKRARFMALLPYTGE
jgi:small subunit ribosomal protein S18